MKPIEKVNEMLDFPGHIKKLQYHINTAKQNDDKEAEDYWSECLKELIKVRQTVETKIYKQK